MLNRRQFLRTLLGASAALYLPAAQPVAAEPEPEPRRRWWQLDRMMAKPATYRQIVAKEPGLIDTWELDWEPGSLIDSVAVG